MRSLNYQKLMRSNMSNPHLTTDDLASKVLSEFYEHELAGTSKKMVIVEGPSDVNWIKSSCRSNLYEIQALAGKDRVLEHAATYDSDVFACFIIDLDLDYFKNTCEHQNPKIVYNCRPLSDGIHYNDIEIFQLNTHVFDSIIYDVDIQKTEVDVNNLRNKLEHASRTYGIFYAAYELLDTSHKKPSFIDSISPTGNKYFNRKKLELDSSIFETEVENWITLNHRQKSNLASRVISKAHQLNTQYPQKWIFSRGHTAVEMFTVYMMANYANDFNRNFLYAKEDIERLLRKIGPSEIKKLPLANHIELKQ